MKISKTASDEYPTPRVIQHEAESRFRETAVSLALNPDDPWIGHYVEYEWQRLRHIIDVFIGAIGGLDILEFGCNIGGSSVVLASIGGNVTSVDISANNISLARLNLARHGIRDDQVIHVPDTRHLPFQDGCFDLITCNSVLEYIPSDMLPSILNELDRVLRPGGRVLILGTSNRLWPREIHSRRWFTNWIPSCLDKLLYNRAQPRGIFPWQITNRFSNYIREDKSASSFIEVKRRFGSSSSQIFVTRALTTLAAILNVSAGLLFPNIITIRRKPDGSVSQEKSERGH